MQKFNKFWFQGLSFQVLWVLTRSSSFGLRTVRGATDCRDVFCARGCNPNAPDLREGLAS
eukprot:5564011-Amphidinium_carterae.1